MSWHVSEVALDETATTPPIKSIHQGTIIVTSGSVASCSFFSLISDSCLESALENDPYMFHNYTIRLGSRPSPFRARFNYAYIGGTHLKNGVFASYTYLKCALNLKLIIIMKGTKVQTIGALYSCAPLIDGLGHATRSATYMYLSANVQQARLASCVIVSWIGAALGYISSL